MVPMNLAQAMSPTLTKVLLHFVERPAALVQQLGEKAANQMEIHSAQIEHQEDDYLQAQKLMTPLGQV